MSSEKTQMVDLLSSSTKKSSTIKNFSKDGFLIDNKLTLFSSNGYLKIIDPLNGKFLKSTNFDLLGTEPIFVEDKLIILTSDGVLKVYK